MAAGIDREDLGSWLSGPGSARGQTPEDYPGQRLEMPESGRGSVAGWGPRFGAILIDWFVALSITLGILGPPTPGDQAFSAGTLGIFALMYVVLLLTAQRTLGMLAFGLRVLPVGSQRLTAWGVILRTLLLVLVIPAVIYDRDRRGLHDRAGRTVVARDR